MACYSVKLNMPFAIMSPCSFTAPARGVPIPTMQFIVTIQAEKKGKYMLPTRDYRVQTGNAGTAMRMAYNLYRKDNPKTRFGNVHTKVIPA